MEGPPVAGLPLTTLAFGCLFLLGRVGVLGRRRIPHEWYLSVLSMGSSAGVVGSEGAEYSH